MSIIQTINVTDPHNQALAFGAVLAADLGVGNEVQPHNGGWLVLADDGRAVLFTGSK